MRVAFVSQPLDTLLPPHQNSVGIWTYKTAPIVAEEHEVLVLGKRSQAQQQWDGQDGVQYEFVRPFAPNRRIIRAMESVLDRTKANHLPGYVSRFAYLDYAVQAGFKARRFRADVIHIHNFSQFVPTIRSLNPTATIVLHMSCEWLSQLDFEVVDARLDETDLVLGSSRYITQKIIDRFPQHAERVVPAYNGVDTDQFVPDSHDPLSGTDDVRRLLFVGRVSPEKGIHDLVQAFALIVEELPDLHLDIVGPIGTLPREFILDVSTEHAVTDLARFYDDDYEEHLRGLVPDGFVDRVRFLGGLPQDELVAHYRAADLLVNPSYSESFGMSLVEAGACGTAVLATRVGGMVEIVGEDRSLGVLVDRGDVVGIAAAIRELLADSAQLTAMGRAGRRQALDRFSWRQIGAALLTAYETAARAHER